MDTSSRLFSGSREAVQCQSSPSGPLATMQYISISRALRCWRCLAAGVVAGAIAGHGVATVIAVLGGSFMGKYLSEQVRGIYGNYSWKTFNSCLFCQ